MVVSRSVDSTFIQSPVHESLKMKMRIHTECGGLQEICNKCQEISTNGNHPKILSKHFAFPWVHSKNTQLNQQVTPKRSTCILWKKIENSKNREKWQKSDSAALVCNPTMAPRTFFHLSLFLIKWNLHWKGGASEILSSAFCGNQKKFLFFSANTMSHHMVHFGGSSCEKVEKTWQCCGELRSAEHVVFFWNDNRQALATVKDTQASIYGPVLLGLGRVAYDRSNSKMSAMHGNSSWVLRFQPPGFKMTWSPLT